MTKKIDEAEVKKECPSCGLGVALDATICEFCGWDFEEEDEWILQIEKLERDLMLEKQRFEPGSVNQKIESTLRSPMEELKAIQATKRPTPEESVGEAVQPGAVASPQRKSEPTGVSAPQPKVRRVRTVKQSPASVDQKMPAEKPESEKKSKLLRIVKK